jgi:hypothetical protein
MEYLEQNLSLSTIQQPSSTNFPAKTMSEGIKGVTEIIVPMSKKIEEEKTSPTSNSTSTPNSKREKNSYKKESPYQKRMHVRAQMKSPTNTRSRLQFRKEILIDTRQPCPINLKYNCIFCQKYQWRLVKSYLFNSMCRQCKKPARLSSISYSDSYLFGHYSCVDQQRCNLSWNQKLSFKTIILNTPNCRDCGRLTKISEMNVSRHYINFFNYLLFRCGICQQNKNISPNNSMRFASDSRVNCYKCKSSMKYLGCFKKIKVSKDYSYPNADRNGLESRTTRTDSWANSTNYNLRPRFGRSPSDGKRSTYRNSDGKRSTYRNSNGNGNGRPFFERKVKRDYDVPCRKRTVVTRP